MSIINTLYKNLTDFSIWINNNIINFYFLVFEMSNIRSFVAMKFQINMNKLLITSCRDCDGVYNAEIIIDCA